MRTFDAIVIGLGGMGGAALYHLAGRGLSVLGIEQFTTLHDRGSSHGTTRIIRKAYFEHPSYVPLVDRAYGHWARLEREVGRQLVHRVGLLLFGRGEGAVISGVKRIVVEHGLDIQSLSHDEVQRRFPGFRPFDNMEALYEVEAGYLAAEDCVRAHLERAVSHGATLALNEGVLQWSATPSGVTVTTTRNRYAAASLVICPGAWATNLLRSLKLPLSVRRKPVMWFDAPRALYHKDSGCPIFGFDMGDAFFYGFPIIDDDGLKVAEHLGGEVVDDPDRIDRTLRDDDVRQVAGFLEQHLPDVDPTPKRHAICMYTMTPDEHFIIDRHPAHANVLFAAGFSGHGFKFAPVVGSALADMVIDGKTDEPIGFLRASRSAIKNHGSDSVPT